MLKDEWKLKSGSLVELIVPEVPPTLTEAFIRGELTEFQLLKRAFNMEFFYDENTTSFFQILNNTTNINIQVNKNTKSASYQARHTPVNENTLWQFIGAYLIDRLQKNGKAEKIGWGGVNIHNTFNIGVERFKVYFLYFFRRSVVNIYVGYFKILAVFYSTNSGIS